MLKELTLHSDTGYQLYTNYSSPILFDYVPPAPEPETVCG